MPIEQIKIGDWILSKSENGGEQAYRPVLKTFVHALRRVLQVSGAFPDEPQKGARLIVTSDQPFWVVGKGWTATSDLNKAWGSDGSKFELTDGRQTLIRNCGPIYISEQPGVGWTPSHMGDLERPGYLWDYVNHRLVASDVLATAEIRDWQFDHQHPMYEAPEDFLLKLPVYNLEVGDFHTYYVHKIGIWVRDSSS